MDLSLYVGFLAAALLLTIAPGPDLLFVTAQSVSYGFKAGMATALGLCSGLLVHISAASFGVSAILYNSGVAFQAVKAAGACYLLYLAWQALREGRKKDGSEESGSEVPRLKPAALFRRGILMNVLNPKVAVFFLALLPQFVIPNGSSPAWQMTILGMIFLIQALVVFTIVSWLAATMGQALKSKSGQASLIISKLKAGLFAFLGLRLLFTGKESF